MNLHCTLNNRSFAPTSLVMGVSPSLLLILIFISGVAMNVDRTMKGCTWEGGMFFCGTPECPSGKIEIGRMSDGKSDISKFGETCWAGHKVLCCNDYLVGANPKEHCHLFTSPDCSRRCLWGKETIATEDKKINVIARHCTMLCCDPEVLGAEKEKED